jgi:hypothetical protein
MPKGAAMEETAKVRMTLLPTVTCEALLRYADEPGGITQMYLPRLAVGVTLVSTQLFAAHAIVGTWKQNRAKAERSQDTTIVIIEPAGEGITMKAAIGEWFTAKFDDRETPTTLAPSERVRLKRTGDRSFEVTVLSAGKRVRLSRFQVSEDGQVLQHSMTTYLRDDGAGVTTISVLKRKDSAGRPASFYGKWEVDTSQTKYPHNDIFTAIQVGDNLELEESNTNIRAKVNLKTGAATITGSGVPADYKVEARIADQRSLTLIWSTGKVRGNSTYTVSADGKVMTQRDVYSAEGGKEMQIVLVYERQ